MELVVDANVVIAALISPQGHTADLFFSVPFEISAPELLLAEIEEHRLELLKKTGLTPADFDKALSFLTPRIKLFPIEELLKFLPRAKEICPDKDDVAYFALALKLNCPLWSNDKELKEQKEMKVFSTSEVLELAKR